MSRTDGEDGQVLRLRPDRTAPLEALLLGAGPHLAAVQDVGTAANGDLLLVLPAPAVRLGDLLPGGPSAGEAVTVLVPLAEALGRLHRAGIAHGGIGVDAVLLDAEGCPSWAAPLAPVLLRRSGPDRFADLVAEDVAAFARLAGVLLVPVGLRVPVEPDPQAMAAALFALAPPEPVRLAPSAGPPAPGPPSRLLPAASPPTPTPTPTDRGTARVLGALRTVRARAWAALGGVGVLLLAAVVLLPARDRAPAAPRATARPASSATAPASPPAAAARDPRRALPALLAARDRCFAAGSEACLLHVDAAGSPVLAADLAAMRSGTEPVRIEGRLRVPSGTGGTALATAGEATVLAVREQNGWRLRDVVAEPPAVR